MQRYLCLLGLALLAMFAAPARAAGQTQAPAQQAPRVWTNEDLDELRTQGLISIVGLSEEALAAASAPPVEPERAPVYASRLQDPSWYAQQAAELQAELDQRAAALTGAQQQLADVRNLRQTTGGIDMTAPNPGITPEEGIANLAAQVGQIQTTLDELAYLAQRNGIAPGVLRATA
jgi:hypothetical protein